MMRHVVALLLVLGLAGHGGTVEVAAAAVCAQGTRCDWHGSLHPCGWITADGVTEGLSAYAQRCAPAT